MKKWILIGCTDRDMWEPKIFDSDKEAYKVMEDKLIEEIYRTENENKYLNKKGRLKTVSEPYEFGIDGLQMYSNLDEDCPIDAKIFEIEL